MLAAAERLDASVADMRFVKPLDVELIAQLADTHQLLITVEDNVIAGGAGAGVAEYLAACGRTSPILHLGLPDAFIEHDTRSAQLTRVGLDVDGICRAAGARAALLGIAIAPPVTRATRG